VISHTSIVSALADSEFLGIEWGEGGAIWVDAVSTTEFSHINFTACDALVAGSAFKISESSAQWSASYLTFVGLIGTTGIDSDCAPLPRITHSNFYSNSGLTDAVLHGQSNGMIVDSCIFKWNSRCISMESTTGRRFELSNCVISSALPMETGWVTFVTKNAGSSVTASLFIIHISTGLCPGNSVSRSRSRSFSASPTGSRSRSRSLAPPRSLSGVSSASRAFADSERFSDSQSFADFLACEREMPQAHRDPPNRL
jgi:hypothetical protein